jgi:hypothetical protein
MRYDNDDNEIDIDGLSQSEIADAFRSGIRQACRQLSTHRSLDLDGGTIEREDVLAVLPSVIRELTRDHLKARIGDIVLSTVNRMRGRLD